MSMPMIPETRLGIDVEVLADEGRWLPGTLEHWRREGDRWQGWVWYRTGVGETCTGWFDAGAVRHHASSRRQ